MAGIWNVNSVYNSMQKKISGKISFQIGEIIAARIISKGDDGKSINVRTLDGWMFPALLEEPMEFLPDMLIRMQVSGYEDGKLKLKPIVIKSDGEAEGEQSLAEIMKTNSLEEEDVDLLKTMAKYTMPLTRENISRVKSLSAFINKMNEDDNELPQFISKYLLSNKVSGDSEKGKEITKTLNSFFEELKTLSVEDVLTMEESNMELTTDSIKSFKDIFKQSGGLTKSLEAFEAELSKITEKRESVTGQVQQVQEQHQELQGQVEQNKEANPTKPIEVFMNAAEKAGKEEVVISEEAVISNVGKQKAAETTSESHQYLKNYITDIIKEKLAEMPAQKRADLSNNISRLTLDKLTEALIKETDYEVPKDVQKSSVKTDFKEETKKQPQLEKRVSEVIKNILDKDIRFEDKDIKAIVKLIKTKDEAIVLKHKELSSEEIVSAVKNEVSQRMDEVKSIIRSIINSKEDMDNNVWKNIASNFKANISDVKAFNSVSGQYYYMDMPIKLYEKEYPCKLIIKDDRKKGKAIDTSNFKMALSVSTINIGIVDAYVTVKEKNMKVDFKCEEKWMNILNMAKDKLWKILSKSGYNITIEVSQKEVQLDVTSCRDFFDDSQNSNINVKV